MDPKREEILARLMLLDAGVCVRLCPGWDRGSPYRWCVDFGRVRLVSLQGRGFMAIVDNGSTPEEALDRAWGRVLTLSRTSDRFLAICDCPPNVLIPAGDGPQTWVRWDAALETWVDVAPTAESLNCHDIPVSRIRAYSEHRWLQDMV